MLLLVIDILYSHMSRDVLLITKEHIATLTNLIFLFKPPLYSSTLVIILCKSSITLFYAEILTIT